MYTCIYIYTCTCMCICIVQVHTCTCIHVSHVNTHVLVYKLVSPAFSFINVLPGSVAGVWLGRRQEHVAAAIIPVNIALGVDSNTLQIALKNVETQFKAYLHAKETSLHVVMNLFALLYTCTCTLHLSGAVHVYNIHVCCTYVLHTQLHTYVALKKRYTCT